jgi:hypothetical protein
VIAPASMAQAANDAFNVRHQRLTSAPNGMMDVGYVERRIWLKAGTYGFYTHIKFERQQSGDCTNYTGHIPAG